MRIFQKNTFIIAYLTLIPVVLFAGSDDEDPMSNMTPMTYETYEKQMKEKCETDKPWTNPKEGGWNIVAPPKYPELTKVAIERQAQKILEAKNTPEELERLRKDLDMTRIASLDTFKNLEIARIDYRRTMNSVFGCAIIQSRKNTLENLIKKIEKQYPSTNQSEIKWKIKRESDKLKVQWDNLSCIESSAKESVPVSKIVVNSAIRQYCVYNEYLTFLQDNLEKNNTVMLELNASIWRGVWDKWGIPQQNEAWAKDIQQKNDTISMEIVRANQVLPRAIEAFREMERTYSLHVMLVIIYDDYLRLRDNLNTYFNAVSQLLEKTQNAQIPNNGS